MTSLHENKRLGFLINLLFFCIIFALIFLFFKFLLPYVLPFIVALVIAQLVDPLVTFLNKKLRLPRAIGSAFCILTVVGLVGYLLFISLNRLIIEVKNIYDSLSYMIPSSPEAIDNLYSKFSDTISKISPDLAEFINSFSGRLFDELIKLPFKFFESMLLFLTNTAIKVPNFLIFIIISLVSSIFISSDFTRVKRFLYIQLPSKYQDWLTDIKYFFINTIFKLLRSYILILAITFLELSIGLTILNVKYALTVALVIAILDILPILGTGSVLVPWGIYGIMTNDLKTGIGVLIVYAVITCIRQIIEPKIIGANLGLHPLVTLMAIFIGLKAAGFVGIFAFPITIIILKNMQDTGKIHIWKDLKDDDGQSGEGNNIKNKITVKERK